MVTIPRRIERIASYALTMLLIGVCVFSVFEYATGTQPFYVVSDSPSSMSPTLNYGDVAVIYRVPFTSLNVGSVIAFHDPRGAPTVIMHRVVSLQNCSGVECLVTKGDNNVTNPVADPWNVTQSDYVGEAVLTVPYMGYISPTMWGFNGFSALLPVSAVGIALVLVNVLRSHRSKDDGVKRE
jgi:signal peptidase I